MLHSNFGVNRALNDVKRSQTHFGGKAILLVVSKKENSSYLKKSFFLWIEIKRRLDLSYIVSVSNLILMFVLY